MPTVVTSPTPPSSPTSGDLWFNTTTGREYVWYISPSSGGAWVQTQPSGSAVTTPHDPLVPTPTPPTPTPQDITRTPTITISPAAPTGPLVGDLWWSPIDGMERIWYNDGNTLQWVQTQPVKYISVGALTGGAGGDLTGQYPNPTIVPGVQLRGDPKAPTPALGDNDTSIATTAFVVGALGPYALSSSLSAYAPLASPALTGNPTAPTPATADNSIQIATTAFVKSQGYSTGGGGPTGPAGGDLAGTYPNPTVKASVGLTGTPTAPTAAAGTNTTQIATTAFVQGKVAATAEFGWSGGSSAAPTTTVDFTWDQTDFNNTGNALTAGTFTIPTGLGGTWQVDCNITFSCASAAFVVVYLNKNGTNLYNSAAIVGPGQGGVRLSGQFRFAQGDVIKTQYAANTSGVTQYGTNSSQRNSWLHLTRIGA